PPPTPADVPRPPPPRVSVPPPLAPPPSDRPEDELLRRRVERALAEHEPTAGLEPLVRVDQGLVTITGAVGSWWQRRQVEELVRATEGVTGLDNRLEVGNPARADITLWREVEALFHDELDASDVEVEVENGQVALRGELPDGEAMTRALAEVRRLGAVAVDARGLRVAEPGAPEQSASDAELARAVRRALREDGRADADAVHLDVQRGVVTLTGVVDDPRAVRAVGALVERVAGVRRVDNQLEPWGGLDPQHLETETPRR
ncbi:MAG: BON domain-containing protein, partial [Myxococcota bacterium]